MSVFVALHPWIALRGAFISNLPLHKNMGGQRGGQRTIPAQLRKELGEEILREYANVAPDMVIQDQAGGNWGLVLPPPPPFPLAHGQPV